MNGLGFKQRILFSILGVAVVILISIPFINILATSRVAESYGNRAQAEYQQILGKMRDSYRNRLGFNLNFWFSEEIGNLFAGDSLDRESWENRLLGFGNNLNAMFKTQNIMMYSPTQKRIHNYKVIPDQPDYSAVNELPSIVAKTIENESPRFKILRDINGQLLTVMSHPVADEDGELSAVAVLVGRADQIFTEFENVTDQMLQLREQDRSIEFRTASEWESNISERLAHNAFLSIELPHSEPAKTDEKPADTKSESEATSPHVKHLQIIEVPNIQETLGVPLSVFVLSDVSAVESAMAQIRWLVLLFGGLFLVLIGWAATRLANGLAAPINQSVAYVDKIGQDLHAVSQRVREVSKQTEDLMRQQNDALNNTTSAITEIGSMLDRTNEQITSGLTEAKQTSVATESGQHSMKRALEANSEIQQNNEKSANIKTFIQDVAKKAESIDEIVFQSQLLAVNSAIEATKAGQYGRGFAVVSDEMSKLAAASGEAASEIGQLVELGEEDITQIIDDIRQSISRGMKISDEANEQFGRIGSHVTDLATKMRDIAMATEEQELGVKQVMESVNVMEKVSDSSMGQVSQLMRESELLSNSSQELEDKMHTLRDLLAGKVA